MIAGVEEREEEVVVTRNGRPAAVLVSYEDYSRLKATLEVLSDAELMEQIRRSRLFFASRRKPISFEEIFEEALQNPRTRRAPGDAPAAPRVPPHVADLIRQVAPDLKRSVKQALRTLCADPETGDPLRRDLHGLWRYRVRRFRSVYRVDGGHGVLQILAIGHRQSVYEKIADHNPTPPPEAMARQRKRRK